MTERDLNEFLGKVSALGAYINIWCKKWDLPKRTVAGMQVAFNDFDGKIRKELDVLPYPLGNA